MRSGLLECPGAAEETVPNVRVRPGFPRGSGCDPHARTVRTYAASECPERWLARGFCLVSLVFVSVELDFDWTDVVWPT